MIRAIENRYLFKPTPASKEWLPPPEGMHVEDVELRGGRIKLHAWWVVPPGWRPTDGAVHYSHGNAGNLSQRGESVRRWVESLNVAVLNYDYPGYGKSEGRPSEAGCYAAADAAFDWLTTVKGIGADRIILYGGSMGGAVATDLAVRQPHRALVLVSTFTSFPDMARRTFAWLPARLVRNRMDNLARIPAVKSPVFIAHGTADEVVPFEHGRKLYEAAKEPKHFFPLEGYQHQHSPDPAFYAALRAFLETSHP